MNNKTFEEAEHEAVDNAFILLDLCQSKFKDPADALFAMVVAIATIAKAIDLSLPDLFEGITLASNSVTKGDMQ